MKSLLEKLKEWKNENRPENRLSNSPQPSPESGNQSNPVQDSIPPEDAFRWPAGPCDRGCGSFLAWRDVYGGGPHCHGCRPWPAESLVRAIAGYDAQAARWRVLWTADGSGASMYFGSVLSESCGHKRTRRRTTWPTAERGGKLVADLDRWREAEIFEECAFCGEWIFVGMVSDFQMGIRIRKGFGNHG